MTYPNDMAFPMHKDSAQGDRRRSMLFSPSCRDVTRSPGLGILEAAIWEPRVLRRLGHDRRHSSKGTSLLPSRSKPRVEKNGVGIRNKYWQTGKLGWIGGSWCLARKRSRRRVDQRR